MTSFVFTFPIINNKTVISANIYLYLTCKIHTLKKAKQNSKILCALHLMPCPFTGPKMFCANPNFLSQPKNLTAFSASAKNTITECKSSFHLAQNVCDCHDM